MEAIMWKLLAATPVTLAVTLVPGLGSFGGTGEVCAAEPAVSFAQDVAPIFKGRCINCHQPGGEGFEKSGLDLTSYAGLMKGTKFGPMVRPGDPDSSNLMWLLDWRVAPAIRMPHRKNNCHRAIEIPSARGLGRGRKTIESDQVFI
jgi:cytochrome c